MGPDRNGLIWARVKLQIALACLDAAFDGGGDLDGYLLEAAKAANDAANWLERHAKPDARKVL